MVDYSKWTSWAIEIGEDEYEKEKQFSMELARMAYEARQGKPEKEPHISTIPQDTRQNYSASNNQLDPAKT
jgi:hypothetical protein